MSNSERYPQNKSTLKILIPISASFHWTFVYLKKTLNEVSFTVAKNSDVKNVHMVERYVCTFKALPYSHFPISNE